MSAVFVYPLPFTTATTSPTATSPVSYMANDVPGMVWRAPLSGPYLIIDLGTGTLAYDTIALMGTNLRATDGVEIQTGTTASGIGSFDTGVLPAWSGFAAGAPANAIFRLGSIRTERYIRLDLNATGHPDGFVQAIRLVVGKAITTIGIDRDSEVSYNDNSNVTTGSGYTSVGERAVFISWKITTGWISETSWRQEWHPMLRTIGTKRAILFIIDDSNPANWQTDAILGRITSSAKGQSEYYNAWKFSGTIESVIPS